ncbi:MAG: hypothetical protein CMK92_04875 [Pseudomonas sp.]|nr:hypothetical protein [Pseudomonas sp.]
MTEMTGTLVTIKGRPVEVPGKLVDGVFYFQTLFQGDQWWRPIVMLKNSGTANPDVVGWTLRPGDKIAITEKMLSQRGPIENAIGLYYAEGGKNGHAPRRNPIPKTIAAMSIGRADVNSQVQQAILHARAEFKRKTDRGWSAGGAAAVTTGDSSSSAGSLMYYPMLATSDEESKTAQYEISPKHPMGVQPKCDGTRAVFTLELGSGATIKERVKAGRVFGYSRGGQMLEGPSFDAIKARLLPALKYMYQKSQTRVYPNGLSIYLDGEIFKYGTRLQDIMSSAAGRKKTHGTGTSGVILQYHIYDCFYIDSIMQPGVTMRAKLGVPVKITKPQREQLEVARIPGVVINDGFIRINDVMAQIQVNCLFYGHSCNRMDAFIRRQAWLDNMFSRHFKEAHAEMPGPWAFTNDDARKALSRWFKPGHKGITKSDVSQIDAFAAQMNTSAGKILYLRGGMTKDPEKAKKATGRAIPEIVRVPTFIVTSKQQLRSLYDQISHKWCQEGLILRRMDAPYISSNTHGSSKLRAGWVIKKKRVDASEFRVTGFTEGNGRDTGAILFKMKTETGEEFVVTPKDMTIAERKSLFERAMKKPSVVIGKNLTVEYRGLTKSGKPSHAKAIWAE